MKYLNLFNHTRVFPRKIKKITRKIKDQYLPPFYQIHSSAHKLK